MGSSSRRSSVQVVSVDTVLFKQEQPTSGDDVISAKPEVIQQIGHSVIGCCAALTNASNLTEIEQSFMPGPWQCTMTICWVLCNATPRLDEASLTDLTRRV